MKIEKYLQKRSITVVEVSTKNLQSIEARAAKLALKNNLQMQLGKNNKFGLKGLDGLNGLGVVVNIAI